MRKYTIETINTIATGKMQFNVKTGADFRTKVAKWHDADFTIAEEIMRKNERVGNLNGLIKSNEDLIAKLNDGKKIVGDKTVEELQGEIATWQADIVKASEALAEYKSVQAKRYEDAHAMLDKELWKVYCEYVNDRVGKKADYVVALANFFDENGFTPAMDTLDEFVSAVGKRKNSARNKIKEGKHNGAHTYTAWRDIFLGEICDVMGDALPLFKFTYVLKENRKKDA